MNSSVRTRKTAELVRFMNAQAVAFMWAREHVRVIIHNNNSKDLGKMYIDTIK